MRRTILRCRSPPSPFSIAGALGRVDRLAQRNIVPVQVSVSVWKKPPTAARLFRFA